MTVDTGGKGTKRTYTRIRIPQPAVDSMPGRVCIVPNDRAKFFRTEASDIFIIFVNYPECFFYRGPGLRMIGKEISMIQYGRAAECNRGKDLLFQLKLK